MKEYSQLITICMVSFHSDKIIKKILKKIPKKYQVIITDNAITESLKNNLENLFKNVKVIIPKSNLGNGGGINFALKTIDTRYALYLDVDTDFDEDTVDKLIKIANTNTDWAILAPNLKNYIYKNIHYINKNESQEVSSMQFVEGCALLFDMTELDKIGLYDEKIFLYFEENDLFFRCLKNKKKILLCRNIYIQHVGNSSTDIKYNTEIELNRNWHYMWSKFYYYKKNYSYVRGLKETIYQLFKSLIKVSFYYFIDKEKFLVYQNRFTGLYNSYLGKKSWKRPNIK
tara:strand:+ start:2281 stop:3138 length:858 start_codon:yes stop_codon:yes gene_type:complete